MGTHLFAGPIQGVGRIITIQLPKTHKGFGWDKVAKVPWSPPKLNTFSGGGSRGKVLSENS